MSHLKTLFLPWKAHSKAWKRAFAEHFITLSCEVHTIFWKSFPIFTSQPRLIPLLMGFFVHSTCIFGEDPVKKRSLFELRRLSFKGSRSTGYHRTLSSIRADEAPRVLLGKHLQDQGHARECFGKLLDCL